jgi:hypothetical protein
MLKHKGSVGKTVPLPFQGIRMRLILLLGTLFFAAFFTVAIPLAGWPGLLAWVAWETAPAVIPDSDPELERIVGKDLAQRLRADARRLALVSGTAFTCGLRNEKWSGDVHTAVFLENFEKLAELPDGAKKTAWTRVNAYFIVNMPLGLLAGGKRKQEGTCGALQADADLRDADRLVQQWRRKLL